MNRKLIRDYIDNHKSTYHSKYKYHSSYQRTQNIYKFHYYMRDAQLQQINIYFEIMLGDKVSINFAENLHEYEQIALTIDALERLEGFIGQETKLDCDDIKGYINSHERSLDITNQDIINILNYLEYHYGKSQKTIDTFYEMYLPYASKLANEANYKELIQSVNMICDKILYEHVWVGININYMDQEYYFHLYYFRKLFEMFIPDIEMIYIKAREEIEDLMLRLFKYDRFTFCMISVLDDIKCNHYIMDAFFSMLSTHFKLINNQNEDGNLAYSYLYSIYNKDDKLKEEVREIVFENIVNDILTITNLDMQIALGNYFLKTGGYDILLKLFKRDHNSYIFKCFHIEDIPDDLKSQVKDELINALRYYAKLMDQPQYRLGSLEQIMNINHLLLEYFKEETYGNQ